MEEAAGYPSAANEEKNTPTFATVASVEAEGVKLIFDGLEEATEKVYKVNTAIPFAEGDRVKILAASGTYVVEYIVGVPMEDAPANSIPAGGSDGQMLVKDGAEAYSLKWTNFPIPIGGADGQMLVKNGTVDYTLKWVDAPAERIPKGGANGQMLVKDGTSDYTLKWADPPAERIPKGGTAGQMLVKDGVKDYALKWADAPAERIPTGGTDGQMLVKNGSTAYALKWAAAPTERIPTGGSDGQLLAKSGSTAYALKWVNQPIPTGGSDGQVLTKNGSTNFTVKWDSPSALQLKSGYNTLSLSSKVLTPSGTGFEIGTSNYPLLLRASSLVLYYSSYKYVTLACNYSGQLTVNGTAIT